MGFQSQANFKRAQNNPRNSAAAPQVGLNSQRSFMESKNNGTPRPSTNIGKSNGCRQQSF